MNLVYSVVADGLGRQAAQQFIWTFIKQQLFFLGRLKLNAVLFNGKLTPALETFMWNEPQWGLNNISNFIRWDDLINPDPFIQSNAMNELMVRFNLPYETAIIGVNNYAAQYAA